MQTKLRSLWNHNKNLLIFCLICVAIWAILAHGYAFFNLQPSHDSLDGMHAVYPNQNALHKVELGRVFYPAYCTVFRTQFYMPYLSGIYTILWISLAAFLVISALNITSSIGKILTCGLMTVNVTVISIAATYGNDLDANMFALLMACAAFFLWRKKGMLRNLIAIASIAVSLGLYQSFICVTVALVIIALVKDLLDGKSAACAFLDGVRAVALLILGGILYIICMRFILQLFEISLADGRSNSLTQLSALSLDSLPYLSGQAYVNWLQYFTQSKVYLIAASIIPAIHQILFLAGFAALIVILLAKDTKPLQKALLILLVCLFPLGSNAIYVLSLGSVHDLMQYALIFTYLLLFILLRHAAKLIRKTQFIRHACCVLVCLILWGGIQTANTAYHKKALIYQATFAKMTEVVHEMHMEGYDPYVPVLIEGYLPIPRMPGFEQVSRITGMSIDNAITPDAKSLQSYFQYILGEPITFCTQREKILIQNDPEYQEMPPYPTYGYARMIQDIMVVRLN